MPLVHREALPEGDPAGTLLCLHGYPESSWMWRHVLEAAAAAGWRALAPDLPGSGDSPPDRPQTWERQVDALDRFVADQELDDVVLCTHDWGALIGLRWVVERAAGRIRALVISDSGFFADGRWHGMAKAMRTAGQGEDLMAAITRDAFGQMLRAVSTGMEDRDADEFFKGFATEDHRAGHLEMYRSGDFEKIAGGEEALAALGVPVLLLWGADDAFAPVGGAYRFKKVMPDAELVILDGVGHFVFDDAPDESARTVVDFLRRLSTPRRTTPRRPQHRARTR